LPPVCLCVCGCVSLFVGVCVSLSLSLCARIPIHAYTYAHIYSYIYGPGNQNPQKITHRQGAHRASPRERGRRTKRGAAQKLRHRAASKDKRRQTQILAHHPHVHQLPPPIPASTPASLSGTPTPLLPPTPAILPTVNHPSLAHTSCPTLLPHTTPSLYCTPGLHRTNLRLAGACHVTHLHNRTTLLQPPNRRRANRYSAPAGLPHFRDSRIRGERGLRYGNYCGGGGRGAGGSKDLGSTGGVG